MSHWFFVKDGQRNGPMPRAELDARIAEGVVAGDTLVWRAGLDAWTRADAVRELGVPPPVPPPLLSPPAFDLNTAEGGASATSAAADASAAGTSGASTGSGAGRGGASAAGNAWRESSRDWNHATRAYRAAHRSFEFAGFWVRFAAKMIDGLILAGVGQGVEWGVTRWVLEGPIPMPPDWAGFLHGMLWLISINTCIALVYSVFFQLRHEATPGKLLLGLRIVRADGARVGGWRAIGRYWGEQLSGLTFLVGYVMAAFDDEKRSLHDYLCDTRVVKGPRHEDDPA